MLKKILLSSSRRTKQSIAALNDFFLICFALLLAILASFNDLQSLERQDIFRFIWTPIFTVFVFYSFGVYRSVLRFLDFSSIYLLIKSITMSFAWSNQTLDHLTLGMYKTYNKNHIQTYPGSIRQNLTRI